VVGRRGQNVLVVGQPQQRRPPQRAGGQVERDERRGVQRRAQRLFPLPAGAGGEVAYRQRDLGGGVDDRDRGHAVAPRYPPAQRRVAPHDRGERGAQGGQVERPAQPFGERDVVGRRARCHLLDEPHPPLCRGERGDRACDGEVDVVQGRCGLDPTDESAQGTAGVDVRHGDVPAEPVPQRRDQPHRGQRVPTGVEEPVLWGRRRHAQDLGPDRRHGRRDRRRRLRCRRRRLRCRRRRVRRPGQPFAQRPQVGLAGGGQRQRVQPHHPGGQHVRRQPPRAVLPKLRQNG